MFLNPIDFFSSYIRDRAFWRSIENPTPRRHTPTQNEVTVTLVNLPGVRLTREQNEILGTCEPPQEKGKGQLAWVTVAAGCGKTTTSLMALALRAIELGHQSATHLTFTRTAALDGAKRLSKVLENAGFAGKIAIDARTLHSCAFQQLSQHQVSQDPNPADIGHGI